MRMPFGLPPPGKGALYVYRESAFGGAVLMSVSAGQRALGSLAADTWFRVDLDPGQYDMRCSGGDRCCVLRGVVVRARCGWQPSRRLGYMTADRQGTGTPLSDGGGTRSAEGHDPIALVR